MAHSIRAANLRPTVAPIGRMEHMSGWGRQRKVPAAVKREVFERDEGQCQLRYPGLCIGTASEIDHVMSVAQLGPDHPYLNTAPNCRCACVPCHRHRSEQQKLEGIQRKATARRDRLRLPDHRSTARHPGDP